jgi:hypothetical protein
MFRPLKGHLQLFLVTHYYTTGLQCEIHIFLLTYTGHKVATLMFIYILFRDIDISETKILNLTIKMKLIFNFRTDLHLILKLILELI